MGVSELVSRQPAGTHGEPNEQFVEAFLRACGAAVTRRDGCLFVRLPSETARTIGVPERTAFTFDPERADHSVHLLASGSALLDAMIHVTRGRGACAQLIFTGLALQRKMKTVLAWEREKDVWRRGPLHLPVSGVSRVRVAGRRVYYHEELLFHFKVDYISDEPQEELYAVTVDPSRERVVANVPWELAAAFNLQTFTRDEGKKRSARVPAGYVARRAYRVACAHMEQLVARRLRHLQHEAHLRLEEDLRRIDAYFRAAAAELVLPLRKTLRRLTKARERLRFLPDSLAEERTRAEAADALALETAFRTELERLEAERQRRVAELQKRSEVRAKARLVSVARVMMPRIEWRLRLYRSARYREVEASYDLLRETIGGLHCDLCDGEGEELVWSGEEELLCARCLSQYKASSGQ